MPALRTSLPSFLDAQETGGGVGVGGKGTALYSHSTWAKVRASRVPREMGPERVVTCQGCEDHLVSLHLQAACLVAGARAPGRAQPAPAPAGVP